MSKISESINSSEHIVFRNMEINTKSSKKKKKREKENEDRRELIYGDKVKG